MRVRRSKQGGADWAPDLMRRPVEPGRNHIRLRGVGYTYYRKSRFISQGVKQRSRMQFYRARASRPRISTP